MSTVKYLKSPQNSVNHAPYGCNRFSHIWGVSFKYNYCELSISYA